MANICLTFSTTTDPAAIHRALSTVNGIRAWWTAGTSGTPDQGGTLQFRFGGSGGFDMNVLRNDAEHVQWEVIEGPDDWLGTRIEFTIRVEEGRNRLTFRHAGWRSENPHFHHCAMKWATFLLSLRDYVETGSGKPFPDDIKIEVMN